MALAALAREGAGAALKPSARGTLSQEGIPPAMLAQVQESPVLLNLARTLAYQKRRLAEEVLPPAVEERVQASVQDASDTLRTILCL